METTTPATADPARPRSGTKGGRPPKAEADRRGHHVGFYVTPAELALIEAAAEQSRTLSDFARDAVLAAAGQPAKPRPRARSIEIGPVLAQLLRLGREQHQIIRMALAGTFPADVIAEAEATTRAIGDYIRLLVQADASEGP